MTTLTTRISIAFVIVIVAVSAFFYHKSVVSSLDAELLSLKMAYAKAQSQAMANALIINKEVLSEREEKYEKIYESGKATSVAIAKAESKTGDVDLDGMLPIGVSDALSLQHERVCAGSVCGVATGSAVQAKASSRKPGETR